MDCLLTEDLKSYRSETIHRPQPHQIFKCLRKNPNGSVWRSGVCIGPWSTMEGAQIRCTDRQPQRPRSPRGHVHWCWAHEVCFCIFLRKVDARSGRALFYLLFPPHFRTILHNLTPSIRSSFQHKSLKTNENLQLSLNIFKFSNTARMWMQSTVAKLLLSRS